MITKKMCEFVLGNGQDIEDFLELRDTFGPPGHQKLYSCQTIYYNDEDGIRRYNVLVNCYQIVKGEKRENS